MSSNNNSRSVITNQEGIHPDLEQVVKRHCQTFYQRPIPAYAYKILNEIEKKHQEISGELILDSGCGTGISTKNLAEQFPNDLVIGIDQSSIRLSRQKGILNNNSLLIRANLVDIWLLLRKQGWKIDQHYMLYPNPWPKKKHLKRRWHGHPVFPTLLKLGGKLEIRTNWKIYLNEFSKAVEFVTGCSVSVEAYTATENLSLFEKKYTHSGQNLYKYQCDLNKLKAKL